MGKENIIRISLGLLGIPLIITLWELIPILKTYQIISLGIAAILYNVSYWTYVSQSRRKVKLR